MPAPLRLVDERDTGFGATFGDYIQKLVNDALCGTKAFGRGGEQILASDRREIGSADVIIVAEAGGLWQRAERLESFFEALLVGGEHRYRGWGITAQQND